LKKPQAGGRVYCLKAGEEEDEDPHVVVLGTLLVNHLCTRVLFDAGATHSFIPATTKKLACKLDEMDVQLCVTTPVDSIYQTAFVVRNCPIAIHARVFPADLVLLDVILGMDWLARHKATVDCE